MKKNTEKNQRTSRKEKLNAIMKNSNFGFTAATTFFQSVVGLLLMLFANFMVNRISPENALF